MLSFGIRFGEGFDKSNILKLMQAIPDEWDYDLLVLGSSPGGIACALEASAAGKKTAIVKWRRYSPAEADGYDEDLEYIQEVFDNDPYTNKSSLNNVSMLKLGRKTKSVITTGSTSKSAVLSTRGSESKKSSKRNPWSKKVRESRLDLNNELFKRGQEGRKLMLKAATIESSFKQAKNYGWRLYSSTTDLKINWKKFSEMIMDYIMRENWNLVSALANEGIEIIDGQPSFINNYTVLIKSTSIEDYEIKAQTICIAIAGDYVIPKNIHGALEYGITCDDFVRLSESPGKTLVVGGTPEALECASVLACLKLPVVLVTRKELMKGYDKKIIQMLVENLKHRGVKFMENTSLSSIRLTWRGQLLVDLTPSSDSSDVKGTSIKEDEFDTVVFATKRLPNFDDLNLEAVGIHLDPDEHKINVDLQNFTSVPRIYALGDAIALQPQSFEISETTGRLLGRRLFCEETEIMDYSMVPYVIYTPIEYAFVGVSEDGAMYRFGKECIEIFEEMFTPIELVAHPQESKCLVKGIIFKGKDLVIGLHMYGLEAGEVIQGFAAAVRLGLTGQKLRAMIGISGTKGRELTRMKKRVLSDD